MSDNFLKADEALQALVEELSRFKSSTEQLDSARDHTSHLLESIQKQTELTANLVATGREQLVSISNLADGTEQRIGQVVQQQQEFAAAVRSTLDSTAATLADQQTALSLIHSKLDANKALGDEIMATIANEVGPKLTQIEVLARSNRNVARLLLVLVLTNVVIGAYLILLLIK